MTQRNPWVIWFLDLTKVGLYYLGHYKRTRKIGVFSATPSVRASTPTILAMNAFPVGLAFSAPTLGLMYSCDY